MKKRRRYWTPEETDLLKKLYPTKLSLDAIAKRLNRERWEVYSKARYHSLWRNDGKPVNKTEWTKRDVAFIKKHFDNMTNVQLAKALGKTLTVVRNKCRELDLLHMELEYWTQEQVEFLKAYYRTVGDVELAKIFQERWPKKKTWTHKHIDKKRGYLGLKRTIEEQFRIRTHRFKQEDYKDFDGKQFPQGKKRIWLSNGKPRVMIKVENGFVPLHYHVWTQANGPVPKGMKLRFIDRNPLNCELSNLELISQNELARLVSNANHLEMSDNYIAGLLAHQGCSGKVDPDLKRALLQMPDLLETKRLSLKLKRKSQSQ